MKRKVLSMLLTLCMVLSLVPATAFAAEPTDTDVAKVGTDGYATLSEALEAAKTGSDKTVELLKDVTLENTSGSPKTLSIPTGVTLSIPAGKTLTVGKLNVLEVADEATLTAEGKVVFGFDSVLNLVSGAKCVFTEPAIVRGDVIVDDTQDSPATIEGKLYLSVFGRVLAARDLPGNIEKDPAIQGGIS